MSDKKTKKTKWTWISPADWRPLLEPLTLTPVNIEVQEWAAELAGFWKRLRIKVPQYDRFRFVNDETYEYEPGIEGGIDVKDEK